MVTTVIKDLGLIDYQKAYSIQKELVQEALDSGRQTIIFCEHPTVITLGRLANKKNLLATRDVLNKKNIPVCQVDRGGDITLHTPGQLVIYPILNLVNYKKDLHWYLRKLEELTIDLLSDFGIVADRFTPNTGVWVGNNKIASIGIGVRRWVTYHGLALNVLTNLELFSMIRPCGLDVMMTSMSEVKASQQKMVEVKKAFIRHFVEYFSLNITNRNSSRNLSFV